MTAIGLPCLTGCSSDCPTPVQHCYCYGFWGLAAEPMTLDYSPVLMSRIQDLYVLFQDFATGDDGVCGPCPGVNPCRVLTNGFHRMGIIYAAPPGLDEVTSYCGTEIIAAVGCGGSYRWTCPDYGFSEIATVPFWDGVGFRWRVQVWTYRDGGPGNGYYRSIIYEMDDYVPYDSGTNTYLTHGLWTLTKVSEVFLHEICVSNPEHEDCDPPPEDPCTWPDVLNVYAYLSAIDADFVNCDDDPPSDDPWWCLVPLGETCDTGANYCAQMSFDDMINGAGVTWDYCAGPFASEAECTGTCEAEVPKWYCVTTGDCEDQDITCVLMTIAEALAYEGAICSGPHDTEEECEGECVPPPRYWYCITSFGAGCSTSVTCVEMTEAEAEAGSDVDFIICSGPHDTEEDCNGECVIPDPCLSFSCMIVSSQLIAGGGWAWFALYRAGIDPPFCGTHSCDLCCAFVPGLGVVCANGQTFGADSYAGQIFEGTCATL